MFSFSGGVMRREGKGKADLIERERGIKVIFLFLLQKIIWVSLLQVKREFQLHVQLISLKESEHTSYPSFLKRMGNPCSPSEGKVRLAVTHTADVFQRE